VKKIQTYRTEVQRLQAENDRLTAQLKEAETLASAAAVLLEVQRAQLDAFVKGARVQPDPDGGLREGGQ
jgi:SMC interacting uncharacterized protein involved in chromosome segregation